MQIESKVSKRGMWVTAGYVKMKTNKGTRVRIRGGTSPNLGPGPRSSFQSRARTSLSCSNFNDEYIMSLVSFLSLSLCSSPEISLTELFYIRLIYCDSKFRPGRKRPGPALVLPLVKYRTLGARTWDPRTHYFQFTSKEEWEFLNEILRKITLNKRKGTK